jgi:hypothetical protein
MKATSPAVGLFLFLSVMIPQSNGQANDRPPVLVNFPFELRLYATRRILEFSFSPRRVSERCVLPLWSEHHESKPKQQQNFRPQTHASPLGQALVVSNDCL